MGSRLIMDVCSARYSPADLPSSTLAAPAKKRSSSASGGTSSVRVMATGLPVLRLSALTRSSDLASIASANLSSARLRSAGVVSRQVSKAAAAARSAASTSPEPDTGAVAYASPVLGSTTSLTWPLAASVKWPFTKFRRAVSSVTMASSGAVYDFGTHGLTTQVIPLIMSSIATKSVDMLLPRGSMGR